MLFQLGHGWGPWRRVEDLVPFATLKEIKRYFRDLHQEADARRRLDSDGDGIPDTWVFNDFGPWVVRYFRDQNRNRALDLGETRMGEMIHTTPETEAQVFRRARVELEESHGCIHINPLDRDRFLRLGAFEKGILMVVHGPAEIVPEFLSP